MSNGGQYNIVLADELDGVLDKEKNRERFASIFDIIMNEIGNEHNFVISHNDYLHTSPAGLILFPGHSMDITDESFIGNKLILADFS
jgi:hypothetical protein